MTMASISALLGAGQVDLTINRRGIVRLGIMPPIAPADQPLDTNTSPAIESPPSANSGAPRQQPETATKEKGKEARVSLIGRVGTDVALSKTSAGKIVASFPLATRTVDKKTVWTTIVAFDKRAEALKENVAKGQQVQFVGYRHVTDRTMKDGSTRQVEEIYAVVVKPVSLADATMDETTPLSTNMK